MLFITALSLIFSVFSIIALFLIQLQPNYLVHFKFLLGWMPMKVFILLSIFVFRSLNKINILTFILFVIANTCGMIVFGYCRFTVLSGAPQISDKQFFLVLLVIILLTIIRILFRTGYLLDQRLLTAGPIVEAIITGFRSGKYYLGQRLANQPFNVNPNNIDRNTLMNGGTMVGSLVTAGCGLYIIGQNSKTIDIAAASQMHAERQTDMQAVKDKFITQAFYDSKWDGDKRRKS